MLLWGQDLVKRILRLLSFLSRRRKDAVYHRQDDNPWQIQ